MKSGCGAAVSWCKIMSLSRKIAKFPVKFPVSREFTWRRVRSALHRQPTSPTLGENVPFTHRKARQWRTFANWLSSPGSEFWSLSGPKRRKSPATCRNIPIFGRPRPETGFDPHCVADAAQLAGRATGSINRPPVDEVGPLLNILGRGNASGTGCL